MKIKTIIFAAALLASNAAYAQSSADSTRAQLSGMGYTNIEIERVGNNYKVEAVRGTQKRLITYDALTGEILSDVSRRENRSERTNRGSNNANSGKRGNSNDTDHNGNDTDHNGNDTDHNGNDNDHGSNDDDRGGDDDNDHKGNDDKDRGGKENDDHDGRDNDNDDD